MGLFTPEIGLVFWMLLAFLVVFYILAKFAWPSIIKGVEERAHYIEDSLKTAKEANEQLAGIKAEGERLMAEAHEKQLELLKDAADTRNKLIKEAKHQAEIEAEKVKEATRITIQREKEDAMKEIRAEVARLSVDIAEKVLRKNLDNQTAQIELADKLLNEIKN